MPASVPRGGDGRGGSGIMDTNGKYESWAGNLGINGSSGIMGASVNAVNIVSRIDGPRVEGVTQSIGVDARVSWPY